MRLLGCVGDLNDGRDCGLGLGYGHGHGSLNVPNQQLLAHENSISVTNAVTRENDALIDTESARDPIDVVPGAHDVRTGFSAVDVATGELRECHRCPFAVAG